MIDGTNGAFYVTIQDEANDTYDINCFSKQITDYIGKINLKTAKCEKTGAGQISANALYSNSNKFDADPTQTPDNTARRVGPPLQIMYAKLDFKPKVQSSYIDPTCWLGINRWDVDHVAGQNQAYPYD